MSTKGACRADLASLSSLDKVGYSGILFSMEVRQDGPTWLPRLPEEFYQGDATVHWEMTIQNRATGWLTERFHLRFRELLLHAINRFHLICPTYILMPDHLHMVLMGLQLCSNQLQAIAFFRTFLEPELGNQICFQNQAFDRVLRKDMRKRNAFAQLCSYILNNAARAELVLPGQPYVYAGCLISGYPRLDVNEPDYWEKFWRIYTKLRAPNAGDLKLPLIGNNP